MKKNKQNTIIRVKCLLYIWQVEPSQEKRAQRKETNITSASEKDKEDHPARPEQSNSEPEEDFVSVKVFQIKHFECK